MHFKLGCVLFGTVTWVCTPSLYFVYPLYTGKSLRVFIYLPSGMMIQMPSSSASSATWGRIWNTIWKPVCPKRIREDQESAVKAIIEAAGKFGSLKNDENIWLLHLYQSVRGPFLRGWFRMGKPKLGGPRKRWIWGFLGADGCAEMARAPRCDRPWECRTRLIRLGCNSLIHMHFSRGFSN